MEMKITYDKEADAVYIYLKEISPDKYILSRGLEFLNKKIGEKYVAGEEVITLYSEKLYNLWSGYS